MPQQKITTLTLSAAGREIDTSTISDLITVTEIWCDYDASDPDYPAHIRPFRFWKDAETIYVLGTYEPQAADVVRIFYHALHTLEDLDSASATTIPDEDKTTLAHGAAGHAATSRAADLTEMVTVDRDAVDRLAKWGQLKLDGFRFDLRGLAWRRQTPTGHVPTGPLDRHEGDWT